MAAEMISRAKRRGYCVYGETLASSLGCTKFPKQSLYYITSPPIRADPETSRSLLKCLAL